MSGSKFDKKVGFLGGGQLGRMALQEAMNFNLDISFLDSDNSPCQNNSQNFVVGNIGSFEDVIEFGKDKDILTIEIENVDTKALKNLEEKGIKVYPQSRVIELIQDKGLQKDFYTQNNIPTAPYKFHSKGDGIGEFSFPFIHKLRRGGYDGKGVQFIKNEEDFRASFSEDSIIEKCIAFKKELSVIVARNEDGKTAVFPIVEQEFNSEANLVEFLFSPADVSPEIAESAEKIAINIIEKLDMVGILAVELFLDENDELLVNEVAPRTHNSGHQTIEGNYTSQFEQHLRAILNLPLGSTDQIQPAVMINLLGAKGYEGNANYIGLEEAIKEQGVYPHLYGKTMTKPFRKMGHVTVINKDLEKAKEIALRIKENIKIEAH